ncbi:transcriptional regulator [Niastella vici]|uniref:Transcriptional regulator n=1 Tax=Niastella vici TaxID=1703345 RepID=A0A1V9FND6_9BACT|nr:AraC family transcriptional regulator [Niastella vici]OQP59874.1 transcriptional regulator [Niastella vici]
MQVSNLHKPFELGVFESDTYTVAEHKNTYFELVFILEGNGVQVINKHKLPYSPDKLFLIFPQDTYGFEINERTRFFFLRFNESYLKTQSKEWLQKLEYIFNNHNHLPGCILKNVEDKPLIRALAEALLKEQQRMSTARQEVIQQLLNTIITISATNIALQQSATTYLPSQPMSVVGYIHLNIYTPEALRIEKLAGHFNVSPGYMSDYFKRQTGETLQNYINAYRLHLIEARLLHTSSRLNEIASDFGLADVSHLNKLFKRYRGMSPTEFRKAKLGSG